MKRLISILTSLFLICVTCVPAMAAIVSPAKEVIPVRGTVTTTDGEKLIINDSDTLRKYLEIKNTDVTAENISGYSVVAVFDTVFHGITDADVVLHVPGIKAGDTVIVRMYIGGKWVDIEAEVVGDNEIRVHLTQEGTVEILKAVDNNGTNNSNKPGTNSSTGTNGKNSSSKSPKTGESNALPAACAVFALCALTAVTAKRKATKN